jgi:predicted pyridoxine 5'-phosphate oxidase superfamily flavin-nucleotide-binding protein
MEDTASQLSHAMDLAGQTRHILLATVDETGTPRFTPVEECTPAHQGRVAIRAWTDAPGLGGRCSSGRLALLLWDDEGHGYQLAGQIVRLQDTAMLDGLADIEQQVHFPQVERTMLMQVDSVEEFRFAPAAPARR